MSSIIATLIAVVTLGLVPAGPPALHVEVRSLAINHALPEGKGRGLGGFKTGYVSVSASIQITDRQLIGIDLKKSTVRAFKDDKGTNLLTDDNAQWLQPSFQTWGKGLRVISLHSDSLPAAGATSIRVDADVVVRCGKGSRTNLIDGFKVRLGQRLKLGPASIEVKEENERLVVWVAAPAGLVKKLEVRDPKAKLFATPYTQSKAQNGELFEVKGCVALEGATVATIRIDSFESFDVVTVPIRVTVDLSGPTPLEP